MTWMVKDFIIFPFLSSFFLLTCSLFTAGGKGKDDKEANPGILGRFVGSFFKKTPGAHLPDEKNSPLKWDPEKKKWYDPNVRPFFLFLRLLVVDQR